jgi:hypothetical protein
VASFANKRFLCEVNTMKKNNSPTFFLKKHLEADAESFSVPRFQLFRVGFISSVSHHS